MNQWHASTQSDVLVSPIVMYKQRFSELEDVYNWGIFKAGLLIIILNRITWKMTVLRNSLSCNSQHSRINLYPDSQRFPCPWVPCLRVSESGPWWAFLIEFGLYFCFEKDPMACTYMVKNCYYQGDYFSVPMLFATKHCEICRWIS